ncbi:MAG: aldo/keto reductase [Nocardioides sp.]
MVTEVARPVALTYDRGMEFTQLGRTGLCVSRLCLGTMNFGPETSESDSHHIMDAAHENGINFFDTANVYGWKKGEGITEQIIGRWFATGGGRRERTVLATKMYGSMGDWPNDNLLSALNIRRACDASLKRLQTDYIDLFQMHHVDRNTGWDEIWEAMDVLRTQGKVVYVGSSNFAGWHLAKAQEAARSRNSLGLVSEQSIYNLMTRWVELEVLPAAIDYGIGLIPWSPLHGGLLSGALRKQAEAGAGRSAGGRSAEGLAQHRDTIAAYEAFCADLGEEPANVGLAWLLSRPGVAAPIIGPRTIEQLTGSLRAPQVILDDAALARLDELFPPVGPKANLETGAQPAPEAYAW